MKHSNIEYQQSNILILLAWQGRKKKRGKRTKNMGGIRPGKNEEEGEEEEEEEILASPLQLFRIMLLLLS